MTNTNTNTYKGNKPELSINRWLEPYHHAWNGGLGFHYRHNKIGGPYIKTKREMIIDQEARNRKMKQIRAQVKKSR